MWTKRLETRIDLLGMTIKLPRPEIRQTYYKNAWFPSKNYIIRWKGLEICTCGLGTTEWHWWSVLWHQNLIIFIEKHIFFFFEPNTLRGSVPDIVRTHWKHSEWFVSWKNDRIDDISSNPENPDFQGIKKIHSYIIASSFLNDSKC